MTGYLAFFWKMATESLGMQVASVSSSWAVLSGVCSPAAGAMDPGVMLCSTVAAATVLQIKGTSYKFGEKCILPSGSLRAGKGTQPISGTYQ